MIVALAIKNIVLIDRLSMDFTGGLCVLSGETGAGKSILLSGIGLVIGDRGGRELIRNNEEQGSVVAEFSINKDHKIWQTLDQLGLPYEDGQLILRRIIMKNGPSRAFINDQSVSISALRSVGEQLIEIHGQHDERGLLNPAGHRDLLDEFGCYPELTEQVENNFSKLERLKTALIREQEKLEIAQKDEEYVRYNLQELTELNPALGEEEELATERTRMMQGENLSQGLGEILNKLLNDKGVDTVLRVTMRKLERLVERAPGLLDNVSLTLERAATETSDAISGLEEIIQNLEFNPYDLENTEERLFALRAAARKHNCQPDQLIGVKNDFEQKLSALQYGDVEVRKLIDHVKKADEIFTNAVMQLTAMRKKTAKELDAHVNDELPALKMDKAAFQTFIQPLDKENWNKDGGERVDFRVSTNPGSPFGGLIKIASGGELSRFILALKVVLARKTNIATLIFDEIDQGVGGAVANAVGERLAALASKAQILVITHSPQVAARGKNHWLINKSDRDGGVYTTVIPLQNEERREEIARMLAGAQVTEEARAAADNLLQY